MLLGDRDSDDVCRALGLGAVELEDLVAGTTRMALPHQLTLATLLIERVPELATHGKTLRDQVLASMAYASGATSTHATQPLKWNSFKG